MSDDPAPGDGLTPVEAIPGARELRRRTGGGAGVTLGVLEGPPDLSHPCLTGADVRVLDPWWLPPEPPIGYTVEHGTYVASVLFGQPGTAVEGLAPRCRGLFVSLFRDEATVLDPVNVARGIETLREHGADIIVVNAAHGTVSDDVAWQIKHAVEQATRAGVLVVVPAGNDAGECRNGLAVLPDVLVVGAHRNDGVMFKFSNWGRSYRGHGIVAPGEAVIGATPGGGVKAHKGTSVSVTLVAGAAALLLTLRRQNGLGGDALAVGRALVESARPCGPADSHGDPERCIDGKLDLPAAAELTLTTGEVVPSMTHPGGGLVYALGTLGYDFGTEARRDTFKQLMPPAGGASVPPDPHDPRQMVAYLRANPSEAHPLTWTLNLDETPVYAIEPVGGYAPAVYERLTELLDRRLTGQDNDRVALPGVLSGRTARLFSGRHVPVVEVEVTRGLSGWSPTALARDVPDRLAAAVADFHARIHHDLRNLGATPRDRALNFAATHAAQTRRTLAEAFGQGLVLHDIDVEKSPYGRPGSDTWDVKLRFFDPDNSRRAKRVHRFTIDVTDVLPVPVGEPRTWPEA